MNGDVDLRFDSDGGFDPRPTDKRVTVPHDGEGTHTLVVAVAVPDSILGRANAAARIARTVALRAMAAVRRHQHRQRQQEGSTDEQH